jgi:hypothetical protein
MWARPPAKEILSVLPLDFPLILIPEPDNEYDSNAVKVLVDMTEFPISRFPLLEQVLPVPYTGHELTSVGKIHLGYLAASGKKTAKGGPGTVEALFMASVYGLENLEARLGSAPEGYPVVIIRVKE